MYFLLPVLPGSFLIGGRQKHFKNAQPYCISSRPSFSLRLVMWGESLLLFLSMYTSVVSFVDQWFSE